VLDPRHANKPLSERAANVDIGAMRTWAVKAVTFSSALRSWGHPRFHPMHTLQSDGWIAADDTLRLACHVRVRNGRARCGPTAPAHKLALADPKQTYARYGGAWHCDNCGKSGKPGQPMHHCSAGCEYDLCRACCLSRARSESLRSRSRSKAAARSSEHTALSGGWVEHG